MPERRGYHPPEEMSPEIEDVASVSATGAPKKFTRRHFLEKFKEELDRSKRFAHRMSFLMIDIDHFKEFNDHYGHLVGDAVLREISKTIKESIRQIDFIGRFGGEELSVVLTETDKDKLKSSYEYLEVLLRSYLIHESRPGVIAPNFTECVDKCNRALPQRDFYEENSTMSREVYSFFRRGKIDIDHLDYWHTNAEDVYLDFSEAMRIHEWEFKHYDREIIRDLVTSVSTLRHAIKGEEVRESKRQETINFLFRLSSLCRN